MLLQNKFNRTASRHFCHTDTIQTRQFPSGLCDRGCDSPTFTVSHPGFHHFHCSLKKEKKSRRNRGTPTSPTSHGVADSELLSGARFPPSERAQTGNGRASLVCEERERERAREKERGNRHTTASPTNRACSRVASFAL